MRQDLQTDVRFEFNFWYDRLQLEQQLRCHAIRVCKSRSLIWLLTNAIKWWWTWMQPISAGKISAIPLSTQRNASRVAPATPNPQSPLNLINADLRFKEGSTANIEWFSTFACLQIVPGSQGGHSSSEIVVGWIIDSEGKGAGISSSHCLRE